VHVDGYPTLRLYVNGNEIDYNRERKAESIISFINSAIKSKLKTVNSID